MARLHSFQIIRPKYEHPQEYVLDWIAKAHARAEGTADPSFYAEIKAKLFKIGLGMEKVQKRGIVMEDVLHDNWEKMQIFPLHKRQEGATLKDRLFFFDNYVTKLFEEFYPESHEIPSHLIHVTCTGYVAPSGAQKIVSKRGFGKKSMVTHAYHMGCYASIPAIRMADGFLKASHSVDIVHTELCSLHMNPLLHQSEQLVVQSLFADGFIKYTLSEDTPGLALLSVHEEILPDTQEYMSWKGEEWGFRMTISKEVPVAIARSLESFLQLLFEKAGKDSKQLTNAVFAIHPGGPKIISHVGKILNLKEEQISHSKAILQEYGNMSSATLPHIWDRILKDQAIEDGTLIVSLAFGPGLSVCGALFCKEIK